MTGHVVNITVVDSIVWVCHRPYIVDPIKATGNDWPADCDSGADGTPKATAKRHAKRTKADGAN